MDNMINVIDYWNVLGTYRDKTPEEQRKFDDVSRKMSEFLLSNNTHIVLNGYIYVRVTRAGVPMDKMLRLKVGGTLYKFMEEQCGGVIPRTVEHIQEFDQFMTK